MVCEDWVGSNPRRRNSLQADEPVSAGWSGEPATAWRSLGLLGRSACRGCCDEKPDGTHHVVEGGMFRRQSGLSGEACSGCAIWTGVRALVVAPKPGNAGGAKGGRKVDV